MAENAESLSRRHAMGRLEIEIMLGISALR
jgi:hypothetical protein